MTPGHLSIKYHTWCANISDMLVKEVCSSQIVNKCYRQGPLFCRWSVYTSGLRSNHGTARDWQCPSAVVCLDPCRSGELSPWVTISVDGTAPNPWWVSISDPDMKDALFSVSSRPAGEPNKSGKAQTAAEWPSLELLEGKMFWKHCFSVFFFFYSALWTLGEQSTESLGPSRV